MADMASMQSSSCYQCSVCGYTTIDLSQLLMHSCSAMTVGVDPLGRSVSQQSSTVDSHVKTSSLTTDQPSKILEKWEDQHVRLLIKCYLKYKDQMGKPQQTKKKVFDEDNNSQTGREKKTWKFHKEMEDCLGDNASMKPVFTFETSAGQSSSSSRPSTPSHFNSESDSDCEDTDGCSSQKDPQKKWLKRKRKSRSSASEMIIINILLCLLIMAYAYSYAGVSKVLHFRNSSLLQ